MKISGDSIFNVYPTHTNSSKYILYYNVVFPGRNTFNAQYTIMPYGCGTLSLAFDGNEFSAELWGAAMTPTLLGDEPNRYEILFLIQLSPIGLYQVTGQNQAALADRRIAIEDVDHALNCALYEAMCCAQTAAELVSACEAILHSRMEGDRVSETVQLAVHEVLRSSGQLRVKDLAELSGYSERQINRLFLSQIGMNVKHYARLVRFNYIRKHIQQSPCLFSALAQKAGYFDQAHLDKDFKAISGVTPQFFQANLSEFYYDTDAFFTTLYTKEW